MRVRATQRGFDGRALRRPGDVFEVEPSRFSSTWMTPVPSDTPESRSSAQQAIDDHHARESPLGATRRVCWPAEDDEPGVIFDFDPFE